MSFPYFISPEQAMRERSELARKGIARGRSVVALAYSGGVLFVAENPSRSLQKVSEIYDRVGFAAVGRFNEFDSLRRGGIQYADTRGYAYDRRDVTGRQLANVYAQTLGTIFTEQAKPYEVELCVAEVAHFGETRAPEPPPSRSLRRAKSPTPRTPNWPRPCGSPSTRYGRASPAPRATRRRPPSRGCSARRRWKWRFSTPTNRVVHSAGSTAPRWKPCCRRSRRTPEPSAGHCMQAVYDKPRVP